jgi:hypothetical protein
MKSITPEAGVDMMFLRETIFFLLQVLMHGDVIDYVS